MATNQRVFLTVSDIMLLEGVCERTARSLYRMILIVSGKVTERRNDVKTAKEERAFKLTTADYAKYYGEQEQYIIDKLPAVPLQIKQVRQ